jgi:uncharacterized protein
MIIVLDTNVLISGLLKGNSNPGTIVKLVATGKIKVAFDLRILNEYRLVLLRPKFGFHIRDVEALLKQIQSEGTVVTAVPLGVSLPDEGDKPFLEVALAQKGVILVTGNKKHYPADLITGPVIMSPAEFVKHISRK